MLTIDSAIIRSHNPALLAFAMRAVHQREQAEDLVQETWASAIRSAHAFEGRSSPRTWLTRILACRIADHYRKWRAEEELEETSSSLEAPEAWLGARELADVATHSLGQLTELERQAMMLCDVQELERDEAAERIGVTRGHLRVLLFRSRQKLSLALREAGLDLARPAEELR
ncbi:MAG TPA: RNA polymerase sigma factor [Polyangiales bacterium]|nr:RNA polymerase sigma factor [Polyangiales bacterium]